MVNVYDCSGMGLQNTPSMIERGALYVKLNDNNLVTFDQTYAYFERIKYLDLQNNQLTSISRKTIKLLDQNKNLIWINLSKNSLINLPSEIKEFHGRLWIGGNNYQCNCKMLWMTKWLNNSKERVPDYQEVVCKQEKAIGHLIYLLTPLDMDCIPYHLASWAIILISTVIGISSSATFLTIFTMKNWKEVKFILYYYCNYFGEHDNDVNKLHNIQHDVNITCW